MCNIHGFTNVTKGTLILKDLGFNESVNIMPRPSRFPTTFDHELSISIADLKRMGYLSFGYRRIGSIAWGRSDKESASISVTVDLSVSVPYLELKYSYFDQPTQYRVKLVNVPSNLGKGSVWYFVCPLTSKRCRILYGIDGYFLHRDAFEGVIYESQTWSKQARNMARMVDVVCGDRPKRRYYAGKPTKSYQRWSKKLWSLKLT